MGLQSLWKIAVFLRPEVGRWPWEWGHEFDLLGSRDVKTSVARLMLSAPLFAVWKERN